MSDHPTLEEVKRLLDGMLRNSRPKPPRQINKQKSLEERMERVHTGLIKACAKSGPHKIVVQQVLEVYRHEDIIKEWKIEEFNKDVGGLFRIQILFPFDLTWHEIFIDLGVSS
jgi:hypothetical protein